MDGFASCDDPAGLQEICDRLQPGTIEAFAQRWVHRIPLPFGSKDRDAGYWWECSMRQVEVSRTIVFDAPRRAQALDVVSQHVDDYISRARIGKAA